MLSNMVAGGALGPWDSAVGGANMAGRRNENNKFSETFLNVDLRIQQMLLNVCLRKRGGNPTTFVKNC